MSKLLIDKAPVYFASCVIAKFLLKTAKNRTSESDHFLHYQL